MHLCRRQEQGATTGFQPVGPRHNGVTTCSSLGGSGGQGIAGETWWRYTAPTVQSGQFLQRTWGAGATGTMNNEIKGIGVRHGAR